MRKDSRQTIKSMMLRMNTRSRYLEECEGECRWDTRARIAMMRVIRAATGCTIRMAESVDLVELGRSKSPSLPLLLIAAAELVSILRQGLWGESSRRPGTNKYRSLSQWDCMKCLYTSRRRRSLHRRTIQAVSPG